MNVTVMIEAQVFYNKNWESKTAHKLWSPKGTTWFKLSVDAQDLLYSETEKILTEMVANRSGDIMKLEYLDHHEIFGAIETLDEREFAGINERLHEEASFKPDPDMDPAGGYGLHSHE
jgi:hypothetical protein